MRGCRPVECRNAEFEWYNKSFLLSRWSAATAVSLTVIPAWMPARASGQALMATRPPPAAPLQPPAPCHPRSPMPHAPPGRLYA